MTLRLAIWDVDGTIVDSRQTIAECMGRAFKSCGLAPPGYDTTRTMVGLGLFEGIAHIAPAETDDNAIQALCAAYKTEFVAHRSEPGFSETLYEGAAEVIEALVNDNWLLAISTGKSRRGLNALFETHNLEQYFDTIWCADDGPGKPSPFMCQSAMDAVGAEPHQSLMIGDAVHDMRMAKAAGIAAHGVSWGFGQPAELTLAGADHVHDHFESLNAALEIFSSTKPAL